MASEATPQKETAASLPADDSQRALASTRTEDGRHIGVVGDTYTVLVTGQDTAGRLCLIDMFVPPGGGPPPHRHDFEETFSLIEGELELIFRGKKSTVRAGETINIPANAPHQFHNSSSQPARMFCICAPADKKIFSLRLACPWRLAPLRRQNWTKLGKRNSGKRPERSPPNTEQSCCHTPSPRPA